MLFAAGICNWITHLRKCPTYHTSIKNFFLDVTAVMTSTKCTKSTQLISIADRKQFDKAVKRNRKRMQRIQIKRKKFKVTKAVKIAIDNEKRRR